MGGKGEGEKGSAIASTATVPVVVSGKEGASEGLCAQYLHRDGERRRASSAKHLARAGRAEDSATCSAEHMGTEPETGTQQQAF